MGFLLRSEILYHTASSPRRSDVESVKKKWLEMETLATQRYKDFFMTVCYVKPTSFFSFLCTPLSDLVLHGVNSSCVVESFLVCLLISDNRRTLAEKNTETIKETKTTILKGGAETLLAKCK